MTRTTLVLFLSLAFPLAACAGDPATRPAGGGPGPRQGGPGGGGPGGPGGRGGRGGGAPFMSYDAKTLEEALAFWEKETPARYASFKQMDEARQKKYEPLIVHKYRSWNWERNVEIKAVKLDQVRKEDEIFKVKNAIDKAGGPDVPAAAKLKVELKAAVGDLVGLEFEERRLQIDDLARVLDREREDLKNKLAKKNETIDARFDKFLNPPVNPEPPDGPRRPEHRGDRKDDKNDERKP